MPSDYDQIRAANIKEYGEGTRHLALLGKLYSKRTHFIFELLQNAEDVGAKTLEFRLWPDRLELLHDAKRLFDENDVRGICGVGEGIKARDLTKIGRFGLGFKSVYSYVDIPEIHSGDEHFRIEHYVRPVAVNPRILDGGFSTLFALPLGTSDIPAAKAVSEIQTALLGLSPTTLLFLRSIETVIVKRERQEIARISRDSHNFKNGPSPNVHFVTLEASGEKRGKEDWLVFDRSVMLRDEDRNDVTRWVEAAFRVEYDANNQLKHVVLTKPSPLVVFFPTEKPTHLGFLIQGPYRTTPARDNVPEDDTTNGTLVQNTAELVVDSLRWLKAANSLAVNVLECLPINSSQFPEGSFFRPIYESVREALRNEALVPTFTTIPKQRTFEVSSRIKVAASAELRALVGPDKLSTLKAAQKPLSWLSADISERRTPELWRYLRRELGVEQINAEDLLRLLTESFLKEQSDEWIGDLYEFLARHPGLLAANRDHIPTFIRLEDGSHIRPFKSDGSPAAFLPSKSFNDHACVKQIIVRMDRTQSFFRCLGYTVADGCDDVLQNVLPQYCSGVLPALDQYELDISRIVSALKKTDSTSKKQLLTSKLEFLRFVRAVNATTGEVAAKLPGEVYFRSPELEFYFEGNRNCWFAAPELEKYRKTLPELGVAKTVRVFRRKPSSNGDVVLRDGTRDNVRGLNGFDPDGCIDGLEHALQHPNPARSAVIWNKILVPNAKLVRGTVESSTRKDFRVSNKTEKFSSMGELATRLAWIPALGERFSTSEKKWCRPHELSPDELPADFDQSEELAHKLGMKTSRNVVVENLAYEVGVSPEDIDFLKKHKNQFEQFKQQCLAEENRREMQSSAESRTQERFGEKSVNHLATSAVNFTTQFANSFDRVGKPGPTAPAPDDSPIANPALRRERTGAVMEAARANEFPLGERIRLATRQVWESKNQDVRIFLKEQYNGHCQICASTFRKRDGENYFEARYVASRAEVGAAWFDQPGNVLCLCATCCAKLQHGSIESPENIVKQLRDLKLAHEGGEQPLIVHIHLCHEKVPIQFTERHLLDLQEMLAMDSSEPPPLPSQSRAPVP